MKKNQNEILVDNAHRINKTVFILNILFRIKKQQSSIENIITYEMNQQQIKIVYCKKFNKNDQNKSQHIYQSIKPLHDNEIKKK